MNAADMVAIARRLVELCELDHLPCSHVSSLTEGDSIRAALVTWSTSYPGEPARSITVSITPDWPGAILCVHGAVIYPEISLDRGGVESLRRALRWLRRELLTPTQDLPL